LRNGVTVTAPGARTLLTSGRTGCSPRSPRPTYTSAGRPRSQPPSGTEPQGIQNQPAHHDGDDFTQEREDAPQQLLAVRLRLRVSTPKRITAARRTTVNTALAVRSTSDAKKANGRLPASRAQPVQTTNELGVRTRLLLTVALSHPGARPIGDCFGRTGETRSLPSPAERSHRAKSPP